MFDKFKQLYSLRKKAMQVQKELKDVEIEAKSNDEKVKVVFNGQQQIQKIEISPDVLRPENKENLEDILKNTIAQAIAQSQKVAAEKSKDIMKGMGLDLPGM